MEPKVKSRTKSRICALQILYQVDLRGLESLDKCKRMVNKEGKIYPIAEYTETLVDGCIEHWEEINEKIEKFTTNWSLNRMACIDKNIIRLAIYEISYENVPYQIVIHEAIEMGKKFSTRESHKFINGILDNIVKKTLGVV